MENTTERPEETEEQKYGVIPEDEFVVYGIVCPFPSSFQTELPIQPGRWRL